MKNLKYVLTAAIILLVSLSGVEAFANQDTTINIKTSALCEACKKRIESNMVFEKGVKKVSLDDKTKVLAVTYDSKKNSPEKIKKAVTKIGYDADEMPAEQKAYDKLPKCCKKGEAEEH